MTTFKLMSSDFGFPRSSEPLRLSVFDIKSYVKDYMRIYNLDSLKLFMKQNDNVPYEYQFDCYFESDRFYTIRHLNQEGAFLHE